MRGATEWRYEDAEARTAQGRCLRPDEVEGAKPPGSQPDDHHWYAQKAGVVRAGCARAPRPQSTGSGGAQRVDTRPERSAITARPVALAERAWADGRAGTGYARPAGVAGRPTS